MRVYVGSTTHQALKRASAAGQTATELIGDLMEQPHAAIRKLLLAGYLQRDWTMGNYKRYTITREGERKLDELFELEKGRN